MKQTWLKMAILTLSLAALVATVPAIAQDDSDDNDSSVADQPMNNSARPRRESPVMQEADAMMTKQIREVSSWMENYCASNVAFPDYGEEQSWVKTQLTELVPYNPYDPNSIDSATSGVPIAAPLVGSGPGGEILSSDEETDEIIAQQDNRIQIQVNNSLTLEQARQYQTNPPEEWQADAGTITIVSTNQGRNQNSPSDFFLVWGAGANGKPVRDPFTHRVVMVQGRWTQILAK